MSSQKVSAQDSQSMMDSVRPQLQHLQKYSLIVGIVGMLIMAIGFAIAWGQPHHTAYVKGIYVAGAHGEHTLYEQWFQSYIFGAQFWIGLTCGSLVILMLHYVVGGGCFYLIRRPMEAAVRVLPVIFVLSLPVLFGMSELYRWMQPEYLAHHKVVLDKVSKWLNPTFFSARTVFYFATWMVFAYFMNRLSNRQDREDLSKDDIEITSEKLQKLGAAGLMVFAFTFTFFIFDWLMSLDPEWYSTLFGAYLAVGSILGMLAMMTILIYLIAGKTDLLQRVPTKYYRDLGNFTLAMTLMWAYLAFSQWLIIWTANIGDETVWFIARARNGWQWMAGSLIFIHFALPFFVLLVGNDIKKRPALLMRVACLLVFMRQVDLFWIIEPTFRETISLHLFDIAAFVGIGGLWLAAFFNQLSRTKYLLPLNDPRFHNEVVGTTGFDRVQTNLGEPSPTKVPAHG